MEVSDVLSLGNGQLGKKRGASMAGNHETDKGNPSRQDLAGRVQTLRRDPYVENVDISIIEDPTVERDTCCFAGPGSVGDTEMTLPEGLTGEEHGNAHERYAEEGFHWITSSARCRSQKRGGW